MRLLRWVAERVTVNTSYTIDTTLSAFNSVMPIEFFM